MAGTNTQAAGAATDGIAGKSSGNQTAAPDDPARSEGGSRCESEDGRKDDDRKESEDSEGGHEDDKDDDVDWEELYACPLTVRFTQEKVHPFFYRRGPILNCVHKIRCVVRTPGSNDQLTDIPGDPGPDGDMYELMPPFDPIHCLRKGGELWSLDNRRLYALQLAAMEQWPIRCRIKLFHSDRLPRRKLKTQWRKFQTTNEGRSVIIAAKYQQFDQWSWFDRAVELELYHFSQRLGTLLNVFEMLPVVGALLYRTGITGYRTRWPFVIAFGLAFCIDVMRHQIPAFEKRICELHVKAVMDGELQDFGPCCRRSIQAGETMMSAPQLVANMVIVLVLLLPYLYGLEIVKLRRSLLSCWLGVALVLVVQMGMIMSKRSSAEIEYSGSSQRLHPKHRKEETEERHRKRDIAREPNSGKTQSRHPDKEIDD